MGVAGPAKEASLRRGTDSHEELKYHGSFGGQSSRQTRLELWQVLIGPICLNMNPSSLPLLHEAIGNLLAEGRRLSRAFPAWPVPDLATPTTSPDSQWPPLAVMSRGPRKCCLLALGLI